METEVESRPDGADKGEFARASELENVVTRVFHARPERVFRFFTDPATFPYVFSPDPSRVTIEELALRPGGRYSVVVRFPNGVTMRFTGEFREIDPPRRIVNTFSASSWGDVVALETDTFEPVGEFTRVTVRYRFPTRADRDRMRGADGEGGTFEVWDHIDRLLQEPTDQESRRGESA